METRETSKRHAELAIKITATSDRNRVITNKATPCANLFLAAVHRMSRTDRSNICSDLVLMF